MQYNYTKFLFLIRKPFLGVRKILKNVQGVRKPSIKVLVVRKISKISEVYAIKIVVLFHFRTNSLIQFVSVFY